MNITIAVLLVALSADPTLTVVDANSMKPIEGAKVSIKVEGEWRTLKDTDKDGKITIKGMERFSALIQKDTYKNYEGYVDPQTSPTIKLTKRALVDSRPFWQWVPVWTCECRCCRDRCGCLRPCCCPVLQWQCVRCTPIASNTPSDSVAPTTALKASSGMPRQMPLTNYGNGRPSRRATRMASR